MRSFLMQTAILARLCGPLCAAVTGQDDAQTLLEHMNQANLFLIRLDNHRHWYRYHQLFRDFLRECLERAVGSAGCALLHRRASAWFEQEGLVGEAIDHALSAQAWDEVIHYLTPLMVNERMYEYYLDWPRWQAALPDVVLRNRPELCLRLAWILIFTGHIEAAERPLHLAEAVWQAAGNQPKVGEVLGRRAFACYWRRDFLRAMNLAHQALARLPAESAEQRAMVTCIMGISNLELGHRASAMEQLVVAHEALGYSSETFFSLAAATGLARTYQLQGHLQRAAALYQDVIQRGVSAPHQQGPAPYVYLGVVYYEWNDLTAAERTLREGIAVGQRTGRVRYWLRAYGALARVLWALGDVAQAHTMIEQSLAAAQILGSPRDIAEAQAQQMWWLMQGELPAAVRALDADAPVPYEYQAEYLMLARIRIAQEWQAPGSGDLDAAVRLLNRLLQMAEADERMSDQILSLALLALAHAARGDSSQALASLVSALALAEPEGYIRTFVDEGLPMRSLLLSQRAQLPNSESSIRLRGYIDRLLNTFSSAVVAAPPPSPAQSPLSERERSILQLIADGRSVQEIATLLIISVHTARTHVKHIYAKLEAHNRVQALEHARALRLL
jgi:LuxR family transcriptional regulator, maltose regulon positive regulatory protein